MIVSLLAALSLVSCQMLEAPKEPSVAEGLLQLDITTPQKEVSTRATDDEINTSNFDVTITGANDFVKEFTVAQLGAGITLPVGTYTVKANTPGELTKKMQMAYFAGQETFTISEGATTEKEVVCKPQNSKITIHVGQEFQAKYASWILTLDDGHEGALGFTHETTENSYYWQIAPNVKTLTLNFQATPKEGDAIVRGQMTITKADATSQYVGDSEHYQGGDAIEIHLQNNKEDETPVTKPTSQMGITISSELTFANTDETVEVPVVWESDKEEPNPGDEGGTEGEGKPTVTFTSKSVNVTMGAETNPELEATILAPKGLKSVIVKAVSDGDFQAAMADLKESGLNLLDGHELVGDQILPVVFEGLDTDAAMPALGDTNYVFVITNFYKFLAIYGAGTTTFSIKVTDQEGQVVEDSVTVVLSE